MSGIGLGVSTFKNPKKAAEQAGRTAVEKAGGEGCHSCLVFSTVGYSQEVLLEEVQKETGPVPMIGCSAAGVIGPGIADESNHSVIVVALADPRIRLVTAGYPDVSDSSSATEAIGSDLRNNLADDTRFVLLFPCGLNVVADEFIQELEGKLGKKLPFLGGSAGENWRWEKTYQYHDWNVYDGGVSAGLVSGDFKLITEVTHGCLPIGKEQKITKIEGNRLYEINGQPAMEVMAEYVGEDVWSDFGKVAIHFCVGQPVDPEMAGKYDPFVIRFIPKSHPEDKSISLPVRMNKGDKVWITRRDHKKMFDSATNSVKRLHDELAGRRPMLVLHFDCAGRGRVVMSEADKLELISSLQEGLGYDVPWAGFFTYGEMCPVGGRNIFHNYTAAIAVLH